MKDIQIKYIQKAFTAFQDSPFIGTQQTLKATKLWEGLLSSMTTRVSEAELQKENQSSVALATWRLYGLAREVHHELHWCS